jgi:hypothetical protein
LAETHRENSLRMISAENREREIANQCVPQSFDHPNDSWMTMATKRIGPSVNGFSPSFPRSTAPLLQTQLTSSGLINSLIPTYHQQVPVVPACTLSSLSRSDPWLLSVALAEAEQRVLAARLPILPPPAPTTTTTSSNLLLLQWLASQKD